MDACVLTVGKFEGIHLGHRALLGEVVQRAKLAGVASVVVSFEPHPFKFLRDNMYKPIFTKDERAALLREIGVDYVFTYNFDSTFAKKTAADFCREIFAEYRGVREIVVGENYRFGNAREGNIETMKNAAKAHGATVHVMEQMGVISTSQVREMLAANEMKKARELLGFPFFITGEVTKGRQLGRVLGFPTLNLYPPQDKFLPQNGVYETRAIIGGEPMVGLTNIGLRPTVSNPTETQISVETHIPSLIAKPDAMYGQHIKVELIRFMRPERRFESTEELQAQIREDCLRLK